MSEDNKAGQGETQATPESKEIDIEQIKKEIEASIEAKYKTEISGLNRKVTESEKQLKARLTEEEQAKIAQDEKRKADLGRYAKMAAKAAGFDDAFSELITGSDGDEIDRKVEVFSKMKESIEKPLNDRIKSLEDELKIAKANGTPPAAGAATSTGDYQSQYDALKAQGKFDDAVAILRAAQREGKPIRQ